MKTIVAKAVAVGGMPEAGVGVGIAGRVAVSTNVALGIGGFVGVAGAGEGSGVLVLFATCGADVVAAEAPGSPPSGWKVSEQARMLIRRTALTI